MGHLFFGSVTVVVLISLCWRIVCLFLYNPYNFALTSVYLKRQKPLTMFTGWFCQVKTFSYWVPRMMGLLWDCGQAGLELDYRAAFRVCVWVHSWWACYWGHWWSGPFCIHWWMGLVGGLLRSGAGALSVGGWGSRCIYSWYHTSVSGPATEACLVKASFLDIGLYWGFTTSHLVLRLPQRIFCLCMGVTSLFQWGKCAEDFLLYSLADITP